MEDIREVGGMATWNPCFSRNFHDWEMDADQNFILKLNKFGRIRCEEDKMVWKASKSGALYEVYDALEAKGEVTSPSKIIWGSWAPIKVSFFAWEITWGGILTMDQLKSRGWVLTSFCCMCKDADELENYLFIHCGIAREL